jgi:GNAT superfamily N-acetyltransferase
MVPSIVLIFLVLGTIFMGLATPTEAGAMGAVGAIVLAAMHKRLSWKLVREGMESTMRLTAMVIFILIGATVFSLVFQGVDGGRWIEHMLSSLPGGQVGFLIAVNLFVFFLAFFLDFFEIAFIVVPLLAPVAQKMGIDLVWFGVLLCVTMQTSFMHPPFGFALFYLRSVAPKLPYLDKITSRKMEPVTTEQIYWGAVPFVVIQLIMVALHEGRPVGMAGIAREIGQRRRHRATLWGVWLDPAHRGRGVGRQMVSTALDWARALEVRAVYLEVVENEDPSWSLYGRLGFVRREVDPFGAHFDGHDVALEHLVLVL